MTLPRPYRQVQRMAAPRPRTPCGRVPAAVIMMAAVTACATPRAPVAGRQPAPRGDTSAVVRFGADQAVETTLLLIGDAGGGGGAPSAVLDALRAEVAKAPDRTHVLVLGDNIYPAGLPEAGAPGADAARRTLAQQVDAARGAASVTFLPGNHDWTGERGVAWRGLSRQASLVEAEPRMHWEPPPGCPGPAVRDMGRFLRVVILDSEWWLRSRAERTATSSTCVSRTPDEVSDALARAVRGGGARLVVVAAHHPPVSAGPHDGHFSWRDHFFPLRHTTRARWLPLPIVGSAYPLARRLGVSNQDTAHPRYRAMIARFRVALHESDASLFVAGHEHQLAVLPGDVIGLPTVLVSGAGTSGNAHVAQRVRGARFVSSSAGFLRLDIRADGSPWLEAITVERDGRQRRAFHGSLPRRHAAP